MSRPSAEITVELAELIVDLELDQRQAERLRRILPEALERLGERLAGSSSLCSPQTKGRPELIELGLIELELGAASLLGPDGAERLANALLERLEERSIGHG